MSKSLRVACSYVVLNALILIAVPTIYAERAFAASVASNLGEVSTVAPTHGQVNFDDTACTPHLTQWVYWSTIRRASLIRDSGDNNTRSYEHEAGFKQWPGFYGSTVGSNLPSYYMDTAYGDPSNVYNIAAGSYHSANIGVQAWYYFELALDNPLCPDHNTQYRIKTQRSYHNGPCLPSVAYCITAKPGYPRDLVPYSAGYRTNNNAWNTYSYNQLQNPSFESNFNNWSERAAPGGLIARGIYPSGGYEASKWLEFNCASTVLGCSVLQDIQRSVVPSDQYTIEVALRCRGQGTTSCPTTVALWGAGINGDENAAASYTVSADQQWHRYGFRGTNFNNHNALRLEIYNQSANGNRQLDVDLTTVLWSDNQ